MTHSRADPGCGIGGFHEKGLARSRHCDGGTVISPSGAPMVKEIGLDKSWGVEGLIGPESPSMAIESI